MAKKQAASVPGFSFVREVGGIFEYTLKKNGLQVLLLPSSAQPVVGAMVTYRVGSRNEAIGHTGATHLLEHLMSKGAAKYHPKKGNAMDAVLEAKGAIVNATTWLDRTNYFEIAPRNVLPLILDIEADRMRTAAFSEEDRQTEMPVVRNEFEINENNPINALDKEVWGAAFMAHPYRQPTIGYRSDIENVSIGRLRQFYDDFYWPDNATLTIAGGFESVDALRLVKKYFGVYGRKPGGYPRMYTQEPAQQGQRRVTVRRTGQPILSVAHKIPPALHPDSPALFVLANILMDDKSSRLYKTFIDTAKATNVSVYSWAFLDAGLFQAYLTLTPTVPHKKAEETLLAEYEKIKKNGVTAKELAATKRSLRVFFSHRTDGPYAQLMALNEDIASGDWSQYITFPERVQKVTAKDVQRVARTYLVEDQSTVGWMIPNT
jgi:zinc protease